MSYDKLRRKAAAERWPELRKQAAERIGELLVEKTVEKAVNIRSTADRLWEIIDAGVNNGTLIKTTKNLQEIARTLEILKRVRADPEDGDVREQEARIRKLQRETEPQGPQEVRVIMDGDIEAYSV